MNKPDEMFDLNGRDAADFVPGAAKNLIVNNLFTKLPNPCHAPKLTGRVTTYMLKSGRETAEASSSFFLFLRLMPAVAREWGSRAIGFWGKFLNQVY